MLKERGDSMAINNNTTRLGSSFNADTPRITARDFDDYTAKSISERVAKANYRKSFKSDFKVAELRKYVYKMVTSWSEADKKAILAQYGSSDAMKGGKLDEAVTETLIINLKESDLQMILNDIRSDEVNLSKKVRDIRQMKRREASRFSTRTFGEVFEDIKDVRKTKNIEKALKKFDKGFKIPKNVASAFPKLKRELMDSIKISYDRVELAILASRMGLVVEDGSKEKDVINMIVNKTLLYVALITGKTKQSFSGAILDPQPFKEVLAYTSYSWAGGSAGLTTGGTKALREEAMAAKANMRLNFSQKRGAVIGKRFMDNPLGNLLAPVGKVLGGAAAGIGNTLASPFTAVPALMNAIFGKRTKFDDITGEKSERKGLEGFKTRFREAQNVFGKKPSEQERLETKALDNVALKLSNTPSGDPKTQARFTELMGKTEADLLDIGTELGLKERNVSSKAAKEKYVKEILAKEEIPGIRKKALQDKRERLSKKGAIAGLFGGRKLSAAEEAELKAIKEREKSEDEGPKGSSIPYIKFSDENYLTVEKKGKTAVPVYVVNQGQTSSGVVTSSIPQVSPVNIPGKSLSGSFLDFIRGMGKKAEESALISPPLPVSGSGVIGQSGTTSPTAAAASALAGPSEMDIKLDTMSRNAGREIGGKRNYAHFYDLAKPFLPPHQTELGKDGDVVKVLINGKYIKKADLAKIAEFGGVYNPKGGSPAISALAGNDISSLMDDKFKAKGYKDAKNEPITPVYVTNKSLPTDAGKLILGLARILLRVLVPIGGGLLADQLDAMASGDSGIDQLVSMAGLATGGKGRATGSLSRKTTHFISGDSLNKKPNPEQVSVNWANKSYTVKPIPQFAEGGAQSASGQITRMTSTERNKPMSVGISSHLVSYNRELQGANDNGDKQALKVYAVNPGITDMVDVNGANVSLIGLVSDAVTRLSNIEGLLSINNQQNDATIAATAAVSAGINRLKSSSSGSSGMNPFAGGFPSDLDEILTGV
jgi:hypothetical protein